MSAEVWLLKDGANMRTIVEMTETERREASIEDWVNQCYPDDWDAIMVGTPGGSEVIEHPDRVTMAEMTDKYGELHLQAVNHRRAVGAHDQSKCAAMRRQPTAAPRTVRVYKMGRRKDPNGTWTAPDRRPANAHYTEWPANTKIEQAAKALGASCGAGGCPATAYNISGSKATEHPGLRGEQTLESALLGAHSLVLWDDTGIHGLFACALALPGQDFMVPLVMRVRKKNYKADIRVGTVSLPVLDERARTLTVEAGTTGAVNSSVNEWLQTMIPGMRQDMLTEGARLIDTKERTEADQRGVFRKGPAKPPETYLFRSPVSQP